jgi:hypothetical protein
VVAARKRALPPDHPDTLKSMMNLAVAYENLNRPADALPLIDEFLDRADRAGVPPQEFSDVTNLRLRHFQKLADLAGCRATAEMLEKRNPTDAASLYNAACYRAVTASLQARAKDPDAARLAKEDADKAMAWLQKAVAAGYVDSAHMKTDADLDSLRGRADFQKLLADLEAKSEPKKELAPPPRPVK